MISLKTNIYLIIASGRVMLLCYSKRWCKCQRLCCVHPGKAANVVLRVIKHLRVIRDNSPCNVSKRLLTCSLYRLFAKQNTPHRAVAVIKHFSYVFPLQAFLSTSKQGRVGGEIWHEEKKIWKFNFSQKCSSRGQKCCVSSQLLLKSGSHLTAWALGTWKMWSHQTIF